MTERGLVVFVGHTGQVSGAEAVLLNLVDVARAQGHPVAVACPDGPLRERLPKDVLWQEIPPLGLSGQSGLTRVLHAARAAGYAAVAARKIRALCRASTTTVVCNSLMALPALALVRPKRGVRWLVHDTVVSGRQRKIIGLAKSVLTRAVAVSEATATPLRELGVPVVVAHNGISWPVPDLGTAIHEPPTVGIVALLTPWKGHRVLLDAIAQVPGVVVEFAGGSFPGDAEHVAALHERAAAPDLAGRVRFLGHCEVGTVLQGWDVVVSASTSPEAGPLSVLEAMAYGKPVIGTDHGGTSEFLAEGAGILVPPQDSDTLAKKISELLADESQRRKVAKVARQRVASDHDIHRTAPHMLAALLT